MHQNGAINILWFKRDLRLRDHAPLVKALERQEPLLLLYIFEPEVQTYPDWDIRHWRFVWQSLLELQSQLKTHKSFVHIFYGSAQEVFAYILENHEISQVFSHEETGVRVTYDRDLLLADFFSHRGIQWEESQSNGVLRGQKDRRIWDKAWLEYMESSLAHPDLQRLKPVELEIPHYFALPSLLEQGFNKKPPLIQPGGESFAWRYLKSFLEERVRSYAYQMSLPEKSRFSCSRLSPYIAWGNLSNRQAYQAYRRHYPVSPHKFHLRGFRSRLQWRCHFVQKFEMEDRIEFEHFNRSYDQMDQPIREDWQAAWAQAETGFPLVDACMRCVIESGYLNFRMRAVLVSFLSHLLWQPWQSGVYHLARQFLDYEPGIHFCQFQMQAGVTGINAIRIYNPVKQSREKDPEALFIRKWLPEMNRVPVELIHEPWKMTSLEQQLYGCRIGEDYPAPIINYQKSMKKASQLLFSMKKKALTRQENRRILKRHVKQGP